MRYSAYFHLSTSIVSAKLTADGILRGAGMMKKFMAATFTNLILRVALAKILSDALGTVGIWLAWPIGWTVSMIMSIAFYKSCAWNKSKHSETQGKAVPCSE